MKEFPLPDYLQNSTLLQEGARFSMRSHPVPLANGSIFHQQIIVHPGAVCILPFLDDERILLIQNRRPAVNETLWELPAGTLEPKEDPLNTAYRELAEETGYAAQEVRELFTMYTSPGFCNETMHIYEARGLKKVGQNLDDSEEITVHDFSLDKVIQMLQNKEIKDAKTIATLLHFFCFHRNI